MSSHTRHIFGAGCVLAGTLFGMVTLSNVFADGDNSTQSVLGSNLVMPYDGFLMIDSAPITGTRTIKFDLYDASGGGNSVWSETQVVNLYGGRFSVGLGTSTSLTDVVLDAEQVWLGMTIVEQDSAGNEIEVELSGRQAIEPAPFAAWSAKASDFDVAGELTVGKNLNVGYDVNVGGQTLSLGTNSATAFFQNSSDQLYISPSKGFSGGVYVGNDFYTNYDTRLGPSDGSGVTRIIGPDNDGATAALQVQKSNGGTLYIDDNELDSNSTLHLQLNSGNSIGLNGTTYLYQNTMEFQDGASTSHTLTGVDSAYDEAGVELRVQSNPSNGEPIFRVLSASGGERLRVEHSGKLYTDNDFEATGSATIGTDLTATGGTTTLNDLSVTGDVTSNLNFNGARLNTDCPGSPYIEMAKTSTEGSTRLCVYRDTTTRTWANSVERCWDNYYGSELCSFGDMTMLVENFSSHNQDIEKDFWTGSKSGDDLAIEINRDITSSSDSDKDNFDGEVDMTDTNGAYCCLRMSVYH